MSEHGVQFCMNTESAFVFLSMPVYMCMGHFTIILLWL